MREQKIKGYIFGMLTALCWAISPLFIHLGLQGLPSSIWATAIGLTVATATYLIWFIWLRKGNVEIGRDIKAFQWQILGGVTGGIGIMARNVALDFSSVASVIALAQTAALFTLIFGP